MGAIMLLSGQVHTHATIEGGEAGLWGERQLAVMLWRRVAMTMVKMAMTKTRMMTMTTMMRFHSSQGPSRMTLAGPVMCTVHAFNPQVPGRASIQLGSYHAHGYLRSSWAFTTLMVTPLP